MARTNKGKTKIQNTEFGTWLFSTEKYLNIIRNGISDGSVTICYKKSLGQRKQVLPPAKLQSMFAYIIYFALQGTLTSGTIYDAFVAAGGTLVTSNPTWQIRISVDPTTNILSIEDGEHRTLATFAITEDSVEIPGVKEAIKKNIYHPGLHKVFETYEGMTFKMLPKNLQKTIMDTPFFSVESAVTSDEDAKALLFRFANLGKKTTTSDDMKNAFHSTEIYKELIRAIEEIKAKTFNPSNKYATERIYPILHKHYKGIEVNSLMAFLIRCYYSDGIGWDPKQPKMQTDFFLSLSNLSKKQAEKKVQEIIKKVLIPARTLDVTPGSGKKYSPALSLHTGLIESVSSLSKDEKKKLNASRPVLNTQINSWMNSIDPANGIVVSKHMSDTYKDYNRVAYAIEKTKKIIAKVLV